MLPTASRVYVAQNENEDHADAIIHVDTFGVGDHNDQNEPGHDEGASDRSVTTSNGGGVATGDDVNALFPIREDQIPTGMRRVLAASGLLTLVTSPGNPSKLQLGASFAFCIAGYARQRLRCIIERRRCPDSHYTSAVALFVFYR